ncbi:MAG TPA: fibronectin type III domain-containing protein [Fimbriimonadaceae bacterium]|nr:fibronectin type III domain-containing protein [Fimbriimonadaceae bacterium]HRJ96728.1 fibronectin type III domain-containing protein [Fimbriimonadaceae bacterium]
MRREADFVAALQSFFTVCDANKAELDLGDAELTEIEAAATDAQTQLLAAEAARNVARSAVTTKDATLTSSRQVVAKFARIFDANLDVEDALLAQLMLPPHDPPRSLTAPAQPLDPFANADGLGNIVLKWKRNGNIKSTVFIIQYRASASASFTQLGTTTKTKFETSWTPGQYVEFRVIATRRGVESLPSNSVVLWSGATDQTLELAAA